MASCSSASSSLASSSSAVPMQLDPSTKGTKRKEPASSSSSSSTIRNLAEYTLPIPRTIQSTRFSSVNEKIAEGDDALTFRRCIEQAFEQDIPYTVGWLIGEKEGVLFDGMRLYSCLRRKEDLSNLADIWKFTSLQKKDLKSAKLTQEVFFAVIYPGTTNFRSLPMTSISRLRATKFEENPLPTYFRAASPLVNCPNQAASSATSNKADDWYLMGNHYYHGAREMEPNSEIAAFWWKKGADKLHANCLFGLACYHWDKTLDPKQKAQVEVNRKNGITELKRAAEQGHLEAMNQLAHCYLENRIAPETESLTAEQRELKAVSWFLKASKKEKPESQAAYKVITDRLLPLAKKGDAQAQYDLGNAYADLEIRGVPVENQGRVVQIEDVSLRLKQAVIWWEKAAEQKHTDAIGRLAEAKQNQSRLSLMSSKAQSSASSSYLRLYADDGSSFR